MLKNHILTGTLLACLAFNADASVQTTKFDPPLALNSFAEITASNPLFNVFPLDFNLDGIPDFNLAYGGNSSFGLGGIEIFFNSPARIVVKQRLDVAALPLGTIIGAKLKLPNPYQWSAGYSYGDDVTEFLGDHELTAIAVPNTTTGPGLGTITLFGSNGPLKPIQPPQFPLLEGDVVGKQGVIAVEFYINGQPHYGYIQFDFRSKSKNVFGGTGGVILGWAYETEPGVPIFAAPIGDKSDRNRRDDQRY